VQEEEHFMFPAWDRNHITISIWRGTEELAMYRIWIIRLGNDFSTCGCVCAVIYTTYMIRDGTIHGEKRHLCSGLFVAVVRVYSTLVFKFTSILCSVPFRISTHFTELPYKISIIFYNVNTCFFNRKLFLPVFSPL
jgi:hypothetical protein